MPERPRFNPEQPEGDINQLKPQSPYGHDGNASTRVQPTIPVESGEAAELEEFMREIRAWRNPHRPIPGSFVFVHPLPMSSRRRRTWRRAAGEEKT
jgi:hypothetical protein